MKLFLTVGLVGAMAFLELGQSARILALFLMPATSHQSLIKPLFRELANRGHHVTAYLVQPINDPPPKDNYTEIIIPREATEFFDNFEFLQFGKLSSISQTIALYETGLILQKNVCGSVFFKNLLESDQKYDVVILESLFLQEGFVALAHRFGAVTIQVITLGSFLWAYEIVGSPYNPSYMPDYKFPATDNMDFAERVSNTFVTLSTLAVGYSYMNEYERLTDECFKYPGSESRPPILKLLSDTSLLLVNNHWSISYPYPMSPHVIEVGGFHIQPTKPLPKDIQTFMDGASDGVIYFSLGSNLKVSNLVTEKIFEAFDKTFRKLKQRVLMKWENDTFPSTSRNVKTAKWFPQSDILAHKNCQLFITHGGILGIMEAMEFGVPIIGMPFYADQEKNIIQAVNKGYGIKLDYMSLTEDKITAAINQIFSNSSYREAAKRTSQLFKDRPQSPLETAIYWVEYVIKHKGAPHLRTALSRMPWYKSMLLDVAALVFSIIIAVFVLFFLTIDRLYKFLRTKQSLIVELKSKNKTE